MIEERRLHALRPNESHQHLVVREAFHHQPVIHATVVFDAGKVVRLTACSGGNAPALYEPHDTRSHLKHLFPFELACAYSRRFEVPRDLGVGLDVDETEDEARSVRHDRKRLNFDLLAAF